MIPVPTGVRVWLATGHTDMRKGFGGLSLLVQETLERDPHGTVKLMPNGQSWRGRSRHTKSLKA
jgi:transposase